MPQEAIPAEKLPPIGPAAERASPRLRARLFDGRWLTSAAVVVLVSLLAALVVTMLSYRSSEQHWRDAVIWNRVIAGSEQQVEGIQEQRAAQALYAATFDPVYRTAFAQGVRRATAGSTAVEAVGDASINAITRRAEAADLNQDRLVYAKLYPAAAAHNRVAAAAALREANRMLDIPYDAAVQTAGRVRALAAQDTREANTQARQAKIVGLSALTLACLIAVAAIVLLREAQRRRAAAERERERLLELTRTQNDDLQRLDREKDGFIASVSHELRTPLTSISGYTEVLREEATNLSDEQQHFLAIIDRNADRLLRLVNDLLVTALLDSGGELTIAREAINLHDLATQAVESAGPAASIKDIELSLSADQPVVVDGDQVRLGQLIDNLLSNAVKFTPNGGRITVRLSATTEKARLQITDSGMGMSPDEQSRLFERFYRTQAATQSAIQGSGLGLAISQAIAHAHHGTITVESSQGSGSTFTLEIPLSLKPPLGENVGGGDPRLDRGATGLPGAAGEGRP